VTITANLTHIRYPLGRLIGRMFNT